MKKELYAVQLTFDGDVVPRPAVYFWFQPKHSHDVPNPKSVLKAYSINYGNPKVLIYKVKTIKND